MANIVLDTSPEKYFPRVYEGVLETQELSKAEEYLFNTALSRLDALWANQFILTCNESGIVKYEKVLGITANPNVESLDFRRMRVMNRYAATPPYTLRWLSSKIDDLLGKGQWEYDIDYKTRTLTIEAAASSESWSHEISVTMTNVKPANLVFILKPRVASEIRASENIGAIRQIFNYKLGISWNLGANPFSSVLGEEEISLARVSTITPDMLNSLAEFAESKISKVVINDTYAITKENFIALQSEDNKVSFQYAVPANIGLGAITNTKIYDAENTLLENADIYVSNSYDVVLKHTLTFKEGE